MNEIKSSLDAHELKIIRNKLLEEQRRIQKQRLKSNRGLLIGGILVILIVFLAILAPFITKYDPFELVAKNRLLPPSSEHIFGTDEYGRDLLTRVLYGARISMLVGLVVAIISASLGLVIGLYASYFKVLDHIFMRIADGLIAIPGVLLAISLMAALGPSTWNVVLALTIVYVPSIARIVRSSALVVKEQPYIEAIYIQGGSKTRIIWGHIFPNIISPLLVQSTYIFASSILSEASLSFLGAGIQAPLASWGSILQSSKLHIQKAWWLAVFPGVFIVLSVLSLNLLGDGLRDFFDPRLRS